MKILILIAAAFATNAFAEPVKKTCSVPKNELTEAFSVELSYEGATGTAKIGEQTLECRVAAVTAEEVKASIAQLEKDVAEAIKEGALDAAGGANVLKVKTEELNKLAGTTQLLCPNVDEAHLFFIGAESVKSQYGYDGGIFAGLVAEMACK